MKEGEDLSKPSSEACGAGPLHDGRPAQQRNLVLSNSKTERISQQENDFRARGTRSLWHHDCEANWKMMSSE